MLKQSNLHQMTHSVNCWSIDWNILTAQKNFDRHRKDSESCNSPLYFGIAVISPGIGKADTQFSNWVINYCLPLTGDRYHKGAAFSVLMGKWRNEVLNTLAKLQGWTNEHYKEKSFCWTLLSRCISLLFQFSNSNLVISERSISSRIIWSWYKELIVKN